MNIPKNFHPSWHPHVQHLFEDDRMRETIEKLDKRKYLPLAKDIFRWANMPFNDIKVVMIGLSPYHYRINDVPIATGIGFGTPSNQYDTPSLKIIREALAVQFNNPFIEADFDNSLQKWEAQGVLLLNRSLTVDERQSHFQPDPTGHFPIWDWFMGEIIQIISNYGLNIPFVFLGQDAAIFDMRVNPLTCPYTFKCCHPAATARLWDMKDKTPIPLTTDFTKQDLFVNLNQVMENPINW